MQACDIILHLCTVCLGLCLCNVNSTLLNMNGSGHSLCHMQARTTGLDVAATFIYTAEVLVPAKGVHCRPCKGVCQLITSQAEHSTP